MEISRCCCVRDRDARRTVCYASVRRQTPLGSSVESAKMYGWSTSPPVLFLSFVGGVKCGTACQYDVNRHTSCTWTHFTFPSRTASPLWCTESTLMPEGRKLSSSTGRTVNAASATLQSSHRRSCRSTPISSNDQRALRPAGKRSRKQRFSGHYLRIHGDRRR